jgi:hypothetical protein
VFLLEKLVNTLPSPAILSLIILISRSKVQCWQQQFSNGPTSGLDNYNFGIQQAQCSDNSSTTVISMLTSWLYYQNISSVATSKWSGFPASNYIYTLTHHCLYLSHTAGQQSNI